MKKFLGLITLFSFLSATIPTVANAADNQIVVVTLGGAWEEAQRRTMFDPYTKKTGVEIVTVPKAQYALGKLRAQVQTNKVVWDVINLTPHATVLACDEGLIEKINHDEVLSPAPDGTLPTKDFIKGSLLECTAPNVVYSILFAYRDDVFTEKPSSIEDVFNVEKFPGKRALQKKPNNNLEWALIADGVPMDQVYDVLETDEGLERALAKLDTIKDHIVWWTEGAQPIQMLAAGEVAFASGYNGRFFSGIVNDQQPFKLIWDAQLYEISQFVVPKGRLTKEVKDFLKHSTSTETLANISRVISYGPSRKSSVAVNADNWTHLDTGIDMQPHMPTYPKNFDHAMKRNGLWWADNAERIEKRWNEWLLE